MNSAQPTIASRATGVFQWIVNFLKTYWVYIAVVVAVILIWRWWAGQPTLKPKCPACPNAQTKPSAGTFTLTPV